MAALSQRVPILMYHSISAEATPQFRKFTVAPERFEQQLAYLKQHDYTAVTISQVAGAIASGGSNFPKRPIALTFDDGFRDFYTAALPLLKQYGFNATLYVVTDAVGATSRWMEAEGEAQRPMLNWDQLQEISKDGIECGAHTHTHPQLDVIALASARDEIIQSRRILQEHLNQEIPSFCYPYGYYTAAVRKAVVAAGYDSACAVRYGMSSLTDDPFALARLIITADTELDDFAKIITGQNSQIALYLSRLQAKVWQIVRQSLALTKRN